MRKNIVFPLSAMAALAVMGSSMAVGAVDYSQKILKAAPVENVNRIDQDNGGEAFNFNFDWQFELGDVPGAEQKVYDDSSWRTLDLPHDWSVEQDFDSSIPAAMGKLPAGIGWYRKTFTLPDSVKDKDIYINFDGAYMDSKVYINGNFLGEYPYGYTPFSYRLNSYLNYGEGQTNTIAVRINSPLGNGHNSSRWYAGAGINRDVTLSIDNPVHFVNHGIKITNSVAGNAVDDFKKTHAEEEEASVAPSTKNVATTVSAEVTNTSDQVASAKLKVTLLDYVTGEAVESWESDNAFSVAANSSQTLSVDHTLAKEIKLWDVDDPNLYNFKVEAVLNGETVDTQVIRYGFRKLLFTKKGFYLNGKYMKLHGVCLHHDQGSLGAVSYEASVQRQIRIMRDMGVNSVRTSHNVPTSEFLKACDEQGMLVMEEFFDTWTTKKNSDDYGNWFQVKVPTDENHPLLQDGDLWSDYDIRMSVRRDANAPSVIMWSIGNEIYDTNSGQWSVDTAKRLEAAVHAVDTSRPITMGFPMWHRAGSALDNTGSWSTKVANTLDLVGLNYPGSERYERYATQYPDWIVFGSETSSAWKSRGVFDIHGGYPSFLDRQISSLDIVNHFDTQRNEWVYDRNSEYALGQYIWTGFDYIGEPQPYDSGANSAKSSYYGSVDTAGFPKAEFYMLKSQWADPKLYPFVKIVNNINLDDINYRKAVSLDGGNTIQLWVSTNQKSVELKLKDPVTGEEKDLAGGERRDWDQRPVTEVGGTNTHLNLQEPKGNPSGFEKKLYQIFTVKWEDVKGKAVVAKAYDSYAADAKADEVPVSSDVVAYSTGDDKVKLTPEQSVIKADGQDLSYISVDITDASGNFSPNAAKEVYFTIQGDGEILGVDNGDATSVERYKAGSDGVWKRTTFMGKALIIVRSTQKAGSFTVTARSNGLATGSTTVLTRAADSDNSQVEYLAETVSYIAKVGITKKDFAALLPASVTVTGTDGSTESAPVVWDLDDVTDDDLSHDNEIHLKGSFTDVRFKDISAEAIVSVTGQVNKAVQGMSLTVAKNAAVELPQTVTMIDSSGNIISSDKVKWDDVPVNQTASIGTFKVFGMATFGDDLVRVSVTVRVVAVDESSTPERSNLALASKGATAKASYQEGSHVVGTTIDGKMEKDNGWGNWQAQNSVRNDDYVTINLPSRSKIDSVGILFLLAKAGIATNTNGAWVIPDVVEISTLQNGRYVPVTNISGNVFNMKESYGWSDPNVDPATKLNAIAFDAVTTSAIRLTFHFNDPDSIDHGPGQGEEKTMLKVGEIQVFGTPDPVGPQLSSEAILGTLQLGGKEIQGFDPFTTEYTYSLKPGETVPVVYADAALNGTVTVLNTSNPYGKTVITVLSEDGRTTTTYSVQFTVVSD